MKSNSVPNKQPKKLEKKSTVQLRPVNPQKSSTNPVKFNPTASKQNWSNKKGQQYEEGGQFEHYSLEDDNQIYFDKQLQKSIDSQMKKMKQTESQIPKGQIVLPKLKKEEEKIIQGAKNLQKQLQKEMEKMMRQEFQKDFH